MPTPTRRGSVGAGGESALGPARLLVQQPITLYLKRRRLAPPLLRFGAHLCQLAPRLGHGVLVLPLQPRCPLLRCIQPDLQLDGYTLSSACSISPISVERQGNLDRGASGLLCGQGMRLGVQLRLEAVEHRVKRLHFLAQAGRLLPGSSRPLRLVGPYRLQPAADLLFHLPPCLCTYTWVRILWP